MRFEIEQKAKAVRDSVLEEKAELDKKLKEVKEESALKAYTKHRMVKEQEDIAKEKKEEQAKRQAERLREDYQREIERREREKEINEKKIKEMELIEAALLE